MAARPLQEFKLGPRNIGTGHPALIIGEVAQAHDGSLGMAHAYIDAIAATGADAVKFQTHIAAAESTPAEPWRIPFSYQDASRYDYWQRTSFTAKQWHGLKQHADDTGLIFLSSPFSDEAVDLLDKLEIGAWKIASGEVGNRLLLEHVAKSQKPVLLSSGMSGYNELDAAVQLLRSIGVPLAVFQCASAYPCPAEHVGLNVLDELRQRYGVPIGLSDHSGTIYAGLAAVTLGVQLLEVHVTLSREMFGPDVASSVTTDQLRQLVEGTRFIEQAQQSVVDKNTIAEQLTPMRKTFGKSLVLRHALSAGTEIKREHLTAKKPGNGIAPVEITSVIGRRLQCDVPADQPLTPNVLCG